MTTVARARPWDKEEGMGTSTWRMEARRVIEQALDQARREGLSPKATLAKIDACYPFGPRMYHPYACWLKERRAAIVRERLLVGNDSGSLPAYRCQYCRDAGCLLCGGKAA